MTDRMIPYERQFIEDDDFVRRTGACPIADHHADAALSISINPAMTDHDMERVAEAIAPSVCEIRS